MLVPRLIGLRALVERARRRAALVGLRVLVAVAPDGQVEPLGQRVDDRDADAVEAAGDLVAAALAELAAGVENGEHDLGGRLLLLLHGVDGDAAAVVGDGDAVVGMDDDLDLVGLAGERLVDRVVDHLVDQVVQPALPRGADVHARALADRLEALEDGDVLGAVRAVLLRTVLLLGLLRQIVPSVLPSACCTRRAGPRSNPLTPRKTPTPGPLSGRVGALHKTALDISRLPLAPDGSESYKMPANRDKTGAAQGWFGAEPTTKRSLATEGAPEGRRGPPESGVQTLEQVGSEQLELLRPDARFAGDRDDAVALCDGRRGRRERSPATSGQAA